MCLGLLIKTYFAYFAGRFRRSYSSGDVNRIRKGSEPQEPPELSSDNNFMRRAKDFFSSFGKGPSKKSAHSSTAAPVKKRTVDIVRADHMSPPASVTSSNNRLSLLSQGSSSMMSNCSTVSVESSVEDSPDDRDKTYLAAREIMTTEKTFLNVLHMLDISFREFITSRNAKNELLPQSDFNKIFSNISTLRALSGELLKDLQFRIDHWHDHDKIADIMVKNGAFLKMFCVYTKDFKNATIEVLLGKYPKFKEAVKEFEAQESCRNMPISSFFLKPVQRLPQYQLMFQNYIKKLDENDADFEDAVKALEVVTEAACHANEQIEKSENFIKLMQLQHRLNSPDLIRPDRLLVREGMVSKICRNTITSRYLVLLNDILIVAKPVTIDSSADSLRIRNQIHLTQLTVTIPKHVDEYPQDFYVKSLSKSFMFRAESTCLKDTWMRALSKAIDDCKIRRDTFNRAGNTRYDPTKSVIFEKLGHSAPLWIPDERASMCKECHEDFTVTHRRHHCRACGGIVCSKCSDQKAPLKYKNYEVDRVCGCCFEKIYEGLFVTLIGLSPQF
jgi:FYVE/RhoGEF/PH domain-containing protein 5/6